MGFNISLLRLFSTLWQHAKITVTLPLSRLAYLGLVHTYLYVTVHYTVRRVKNSPQCSIGGTQRHILFYAVLYALSLSKYFHELFPCFKAHWFSFLILFPCMHVVTDSHISARLIFTNFLKLAQVSCSGNLIIRDISLEVGFLLRNWWNDFRGETANRALDVLHSWKALRLTITCEWTSKVRKDRLRHLIPLMPGKNKQTNYIVDKWPGCVIQVWDFCFRFNNHLNLKKYFGRKINFFSNLK